MLLTMEHAYKEENKVMPNPERMDKVLDSMENLEFVVRERNRAYFELETGTSGEKERHLAHHLPEDVELTGMDSRYHKLLIDIDQRSVFHISFPNPKTDDSIAPFLTKFALRPDHALTQKLFVYTSNGVKDELAPSTNYSRNAGRQFLGPY